MLHQILIIFGITMAPLVCGQQTDPGCTRYAFIDLYILLDVYSSNSENFNRSFRFAENLVRAIDFNFARLAFWTGHRCTNESRHNRLCSSTDDFRFNNFQSGQNDQALFHRQLTMIMDRLQPADWKKAQAVHRLFTPGEIGGKLIEGIKWLGELKRLKRQNAELVMWVLTPGLHPSEDTWAQLREARSHLVNVVRFGTQLQFTWSTNDPIWRDLPALLFSKPSLQYGRITNINRTKLDTQEWLKTNLDHICTLTIDCHFEVNLTIRSRTPCRFDQRRNCQRDLSASIIIHKAAKLGGTACPTQTIEQCISYELCIDTCDSIDTQPWQSWGQCSCVNQQRSRIRLPRPGYPAIGCELQISQFCICTTTTRAVTTTKSTEATQTTIATQETSITTPTTQTTIKPVPVEPETSVMTKVTIEIVTPVVTFTISPNAKDDGGLTIVIIIVVLLTLLAVVAAICYFTKKKHGESKLIKKRGSQLPKITVAGQLREKVPREAETGSFRESSSTQSSHRFSKSRNASWKIPPVFITRRPIEAWKERKIPTVALRPKVYSRKADLKQPTDVMEKKLIDYKASPAVKKTIVDEQTMNLSDHQKSTLAKRKGSLSLPPMKPLKSSGSMPTMQQPGKSLSLPPMQPMP